MENSKTDYVIEDKELKIKNIIKFIKDYLKYISIGIITVSTVTFYWIFYYKQIPKIKNYIVLWITCISQNENLNDLILTVEKCTIDNANELPSYNTMIAAETSVSIVGIWLFSIFFKDTFLYDFYVYIKNNYVIKFKKLIKKNDKNEDFFNI